MAEIGTLRLHLQDAEGRRFNMVKRDVVRPEPGESIQHVFDVPAGSMATHTSFTVDMPLSATIITGDFDSTFTISVRNDYELPPRLRPARRRGWWCRNFCGDSHG